MNFACWPSAFRRQPRPRHRASRWQSSSSETRTRRSTRPATITRFALRHASRIEQSSAQLIQPSTHSDVGRKEIASATPRLARRAISRTATFQPDGRPDDSAIRAGQRRSDQAPERVHRLSIRQSAKGAVMAASEGGRPVGSGAAPTEDEQRLHELGYRQELARAWSGFTNFAISFTIISVLAGTFTTFSFAWQNGGPIAVSIGWPVLCFFVLMVAFSMAELTSRYPTAGGPYWWAHDLGGKGWSWMTGWFNIVGLVGIVASVGYGCAIFLNATLALYEVDIFVVNFGDSAHILSETWLLFFLILVLYTLVNIFGDRILALANNVSVGWHVIGVAVVIGLLVFVPDDHQSASFVFGERINNSGLHDGSSSNLGFWLLVLPIGFLLTMYTQTGYDASAHTAEETRGAAISAAQGVWRSVFFSAVIGWFVLLAFLFAANDVKAVNDGAGFVGAIFTSSMDPWAAKKIGRAH